MNIKRQSCLKSISYLVIASMLGLTGYIPASQASMVTAQALMQAEHNNAERERVRSLFLRDDVKSALTERGVDVEQAMTRVNSLTDAEIRDLAGKIDQLPAGAGVVELIVVVFLVLVVTDLLGVTDVFTFVKKH